LGDARLGLEILTNNLSLSDELMTIALQRLHQPSPRVALGQALRGIASAAIDVSDGLIGDLGHILQRSSVGAIIEAACLPVGAALRSQGEQTQLEFALTGGDDYELCFCAAPVQKEKVMAAASKAGVTVTRIGKIEPMPGLNIVDAAGHKINVRSHPFDHFALS
jgi:thiamine-monophosphate kinase